MIDAIKKFFNIKDIEEDNIDYAQIAREIKEFVKEDPKRDDIDFQGENFSGSTQSVYEEKYGDDIRTVEEKIIDQAEQKTHEHNYGGMVETWESPKRNIESACIDDGFCCSAVMNINDMLPYSRTAINHINSLNNFSRSNVIVNNGVINNFYGVDEEELAKKYNEYNKGHQEASVKACMEKIEATNVDDFLLD